MFLEFFFSFVNIFIKFKAYKSTKSNINDTNNICIVIRMGPKHFFDYRTFDSNLSNNTHEDELNTELNKNSEQLASNKLSPGTMVDKIPACMRKVLTCGIY